MTWKCIVCETINRDRVVVCEVCDTLRAGADPSAQTARSEIACVKVESHSPFRSIEEYIYEIRSSARIIEKKILRVNSYVKWFAFIFIPLFIIFSITTFLK